MAWRSFFAVQQQLFFGAINKTEVQKIDIKIEVEVSSWLWLDQRPYFCPNQDPEAVFLDFDLSKLSKYQFFFCFGVFFSSANCICLSEISKITEQKYSLLLLQQLQLLLRKGKQIIKNGFSACKKSFYVKNFRLLQQCKVMILKKSRPPDYSA